MARFVNKLQVQQMKYMFQMTLHKLELHVPYDVSVMCVLKQGSRRLESETSATIGKGQPIADFKDEKLTIVNRVKKDKATKKFHDREVSAASVFLTLFIFARATSSCKSNGASRQSPLESSKSTSLNS